MAAKKFPIKPAHPERVCWGCDKYCPADAMQCGNGTVATLHPSELFGDDWLEWGLDAGKAQAQELAAEDALPSQPGRPSTRGRDSTGQ